jgi:hypothetical protein
MYGITSYDDHYCSNCGRSCNCTGTSSGIFQVGYGSYRTSKEIQEERRQFKLKKELRRWAFRQMSIEMGRDYSPKPEPKPTIHTGVPSTAFHWMSQRKRAFKMRASKPGWDRGR